MQIIPISCCHNYYHCLKKLSAIINLQRKEHSLNFFACLGENRKDVVAISLMLKCICQMLAAVCKRQQLQNQKLLYQVVFFLSLGQKFSLDRFHIENYWSSLGSYLGLYTWSNLNTGETSSVSDCLHINLSRRKQVVTLFCIRHKYYGY